MPDREDSKVTRLVNLTLALLAARRALTWPEIAASVPGYAGRRPSDPALRRMFERDKEELREQGVPLETVGRPGDADTRYSIRASAYALPPVRLDRGTATVLALAARLWGSVAAGSPVRDALRKLDAGGAGDVLEVDLPALDVRLGQGEPALAPLWTACRQRRAVLFTYRTAGGEAAQERTVEPWGVVCWRGRWYLVGLDTGRGGRRVFRLSRIRSAVRAVGPAGVVQVPADLDLRAEVAAIAERPRPFTARVAVPAGRCPDLRRQASEVLEQPDGTEVLVVPYAVVEEMAGTVRAERGARALEPPELVATVRAGLQAVVDLHARGHA